MSLPDHMTSSGLVTERRFQVIVRRSGWILKSSPMNAVHLSPVRAVNGNDAKEIYNGGVVWSLQRPTTRQAN